MPRRTPLDRSAPVGVTTAPRGAVAFGLGLLLAITGCSSAAGDRAAPGATGADPSSTSTSSASTSSASTSSAPTSSASTSSAPTSSAPTSSTATAQSTARAGARRTRATSATTDGSSAAAAAAKPVVLAFAGDIADGTAGSPAFETARATGDVVRRIAPRWVLAGGDNAYSSGSLADYRTKYDPTWGSFKAITKAVPGNHEYRTAGAAGYRQYFFGGASRPYEAFSAGNGWRVYLLNCEIACGSGSAQERWLRKDLAAHPAAHVLAVVHRPLYSSGKHGNDTRVRALWDALAHAKADVVLSGHDHCYEVFAKQDARGRARPADGIKEFVNGTGGAEMYPFSTPRPNSLKRLNRDFGVLKLTLRPTTYSWQFIASGYCWTNGERGACPSRRGRVLDTGARPTNRRR